MIDLRVDPKEPLGLRHFKPCRFAAQISTADPSQLSFFADCILFRQKIIPAKIIYD
jgi:hypothetical protein